MRATIAVLTREFHERRVILVAALVAGLLPLASPLFPGVATGRAGEARELMAQVLALGFGLALAAMLGASIVGRDLSENRLGFDFALPIGSGAICAGRFGAALALVFAAALAVVAPTAILSGGLRLNDIGDSPATSLLLGALGTVLLLVPLTHAVGIAFRARSRWLALDLVAGCVVLLLVGSAAGHLYNAFAESMAWTSAMVFSVMAIPVFWVASSVQVVRGRTDLERGHRALSLALWPALLVIAVAVVGYSRWFTAVEPSDLEHVRAQASPRGAWVHVHGPARWRPGLWSSFLLDTGSGRSIAMQPCVWDVQFSQDGARAAWLRMVRPNAETVEVMAADLEETPPTVRATTIVLGAGAWNWQIALSPSGQRVAVLNPPSLVVYDVDSGAIVAAVRPEDLGEGTERNQLAFATEERVRLYAMDRRLTIHELDVSTRQLVTVAGPAFETAYPVIRWSPDHSRLLLRDSGVPGAWLLDGATGASVASMGIADGRGRFLADGRFVILEADARRLHLFSKEGEEQRVVAFDAARGIGLGGEIEPGVILLSFSWPWKLVALDLATGEVRQLALGGPALSNEMPSEPGSVASRLVFRDGSLSLLDPRSGELRSILGTP